MRKIIKKPSRRTVVAVALVGLVAGIVTVLNSSNASAQVTSASQTANGQSITAAAAGLDGRWVVIADQGKGSSKLNIYRTAKKYAWVTLTNRAKLLASSGEVSVQYKRSGKGNKWHAMLTSAGPEVEGSNNFKIYKNHSICARVHIKGGDSKSIGCWKNTVSPGSSTSTTADHQVTARNQVTLAA